MINLTGKISYKDLNLLLSTYKLAEKNGSGRFKTSDGNYVKMTFNDFPNWDNKDDVFPNESLIE